LISLPFMHAPAHAGLCFVVSSGVRRCAARGLGVPARISPWPRQRPAQADRILPWVTCPSFDAVPSPLQKISRWCRRIPLSVGSFLCRTLLNPLLSNIASLHPFRQRGGRKRLQISKIPSRRSSPTSVASTVFRRPGYPVKTRTASVMQIAKQAAFLSVVRKEVNNRTRHSRRCSVASSDEPPKSLPDF
jgi:hypothetical protein